MGVRRLVVLFGVVVLSMACTACTWSDDGGDGTEYVDWHGSNAEYHAAIPKFPFPLPEGIDFPADLPYNPPQDDNTLFWVGQGELTTYLFAECAFLSVVVANESVDFDAAMSALDSVEDVNNAPFYRMYVKEIGPPFRLAINRARDGDFSVLNEYFQHACVGGWMGFK